MSTSEGAFDATDRGLLLGDGLFETLLIKRGRPVFFDAHMARLRNGADQLGIPLRQKDTEILSVIQRLFDKVDDSARDCAARITLTRGAGARGVVPPDIATVTPSLCISLVPVSAPPADPLRLIVSSVRRNEGSPTSRLKTLSYTDNMLARMEAERFGAGEAIMLNNADNVACASVANLFVLRHPAVLETPDVSSGVLPGVVRNIVLELATDIGLEVREGEIAVSGLREGELFLTNSLQGLRAAYIAPGHDSQGSIPTPSNVFLELQRQYAHRVEIDISRNGAS